MKVRQILPDRLVGQGDTLECQYAKPLWFRVTVSTPWWFCSSHTRRWIGFARATRVEFTGEVVVDKNVSVCFSRGAGYFSCDEASSMEGMAFVCIRLSK